MRREILPLPGLVLVHGGAHAADCWDLTVAELHRQEPRLKVLAVDLPGRRGKQGDLSTASIRQWVDSVVDDIEHADLGQVVIVGHSLAGVTVPGVVARLGASRVREMVFAAAFVPPQDSAVIDTLGGPLAAFARRSAATGKPMKLSRVLARYAFCNGMTRDQRAFTLSRLYAESACIGVEPVDRSNLPTAVSRTWILTTRDRALSISSQQASIAALGGVQTVIPIHACHDVMISHARELAVMLVDRCRATAAA